MPTPTISNLQLCYFEIYLSWRFVQFINEPPGQIEEAKGFYTYQFCFSVAYFFKSIAFEFYKPASRIFQDFICKLPDFKVHGVEKGSIISHIKTHGILTWSQSCSIQVIDVVIAFSPVIDEAKQIVWICRAYASYRQ